jgi:hypothetical protein
MRQNTFAPHQFSVLPRIDFPRTEHSEVTEVCIQVGDWLVDEKGCIRDFLIEVSWSSFPFVSGAGVDLESKYKAEHLFQFEHTTELLLLKGRLNAAAFTKHLDDARLLPFMRSSAVPGGSSKIRF